MRFVRQTSIETFNLIKTNGLLSRLRFFVYEILYKHGPMTGNEIIKHVGRIHNTGSLNTRLSELRNLGVVYEVKTISDPITGRQVILWDVTNGLPIKLDKPKRIKCNTCKGKGYISESQLRMF